MDQEKMRMKSTLLSKVRRRTEEARREAGRTNTKKT